MSIAVLKAKTPRKGVKCRRVSQCGWLSAKWRDASQFKNKMNPICEAFTACVCASAPAVQAEGVLALQVRRERCRGKRREEGREEAHPARVEGTHVRLLEAADLQLRGLVLRVHGARERPPVEVAPLRGWTALQRAPLRCTCTSQLRRVLRNRQLMLVKRWTARTVPRVRACVCVVVREWVGGRLPSSAIQVNRKNIRWRENLTLNS